MFTPGDPHARPVLRIERIQREGQLFSYAKHALKTSNTAERKKNWSFQAFCFDKNYGWKETLYMDCWDVMRARVSVNRVYPGAHLFERTYEHSFFFFVKTWHKSIYAFLINRIFEK